MLIETHPMDGFTNGF